MSQRGLRDGAEKHSPGNFVDPHHHRPSPHREKPEGNRERSGPEQGMAEQKQPGEGSPPQSTKLMQRICIFHKLWFREIGRVNQSAGKACLSWCQADSPGLRRVSLSAVEHSFK